MKLSFSLLATAINAQTDSPGDIGPYLDELQSYCEQTYGLTNNGLPNKWTRRKVFQTKTNFNISFC